MFDLLSSLPAIPEMTFINVGAMALGEEPYDRFMQKGTGKVIGFEPVAEECENLNRLHRNSKHLFLPYVVGDGSRQTFNICNYPMTSSFFTPNVPLIRLFSGLEEVMQVVDSMPVITRRLDDIPEVAGADYLKMDVQGAELQVLHGAREMLKQTVMVHTEVEFVHLYEGQPLFGDIDAELRAQGFIFHKFVGFAGKPFKPFELPGGGDGPTNQYLWSDALYVRDFTRLGELSPQKLLKLAILLHELYSSVDLCAVTLKAFDEMTGFKLYENYCRAVTS